MTSLHASLRFHAIEGSPFIRQEQENGKTILTLPDPDRHQGRVLSVYRNGVPLWFDARADRSIVIRSIKLQGDRMEIRVESPQEPLQPLRLTPRTVTPADLSYGLQRPAEGTYRNPHA